MATLTTRPLNLTDHDWSTYSKCSEVDPDIMFPNDKNPGAIQRAKNVCHGCPVITQCIEARERTGDQHGVWGAKTAEEHRAAKKAAYRRQWRKDRRETLTETAA